MKFADPHPGGRQLRQRLTRVFKLNGQMTTIVVHPDDPPEIIIKFTEKFDELTGRFNRAQRFRLQPQMQIATAHSHQLFNVRRTLQQVLTGRLPLERGPVKPLKGQRQRAHTPLPTARHQLRHQIK